MREISDVFLLNVAEVSSALVGLFIVGVFLYVETGVRRGGAVRTELEASYIRASTQIVIILYAIPIGLSLTLVAMELIWSRLLLLILSILLVVTNVDTVRRVRQLTQAHASPMLLATELIGTAGVVLIITLPWILGGLEPSSEDLTWAILLSFATGFIGIWAMVLTAFDMGRREAVEQIPPAQPSPPPARRPAPAGRKDQKPSG
jgi:hypothetical protein